MKLLPARFQGLFVGMVNRLVGQAEFSTTELVQTGLLQLRGENDFQRRRIDAQQMQIEQRMDVRAQEQSIRNVIRFGSLVWQDVGRFERIHNVVSGNRASPPVRVN